MSRINFVFISCLVNFIFSFLDKILDRSVQTTAEGMQMKHEIVCKLIDSNSTAIPAPYMSKLQLYQREGPYCQSIQNIEMSNP